MVCHCHVMTTQNTKKHMDALQKHVDQNEYKCRDIIIMEWYTQSTVRMKKAVIMSLFCFARRLIYVVLQLNLIIMPQEIHQERVGELLQSISVVTVTQMVT